MFKAIFNPRISEWNEIQEMGIPLEIGKDYDVQNSKIPGNLDILVNGKVDGSFPSNWFEF
jgi:hypothetical protein